MRKDRPNKIPQPKTIARHYAEGKFCDYPSDIILSAVNSCDYEYNPTTIPVRLGFEQMFMANVQSFLYLRDNRNSVDMNEFLANPDKFMERAGVNLMVPFDDYFPRILVALLEDEMLDALMNPSDDKVFRLIHCPEPGSWQYRHPERYPKAYMERRPLRLDGIPTIVTDQEYEALGIGRHICFDLYLIKKFFSEE